MTDPERLLVEKYAGVQTLAFFSDCDRLAAGEPLAYVIGWQPFLGLVMYLDSKPLIPRPETEWWAEKLFSATSEAEDFVSSESRSVAAREEVIFQQKNITLSANKFPAKPFRFLDLCAGSGAIGCAALKYLPYAEVYFGEIDPAHGATILKNIRVNDLDEARAHVGFGDLFAPFDDMQFDIIAANPPYIPADRELETSVAHYEPALALRSGVDGLDLIRRIATELPNHLAPGGAAWIECDSAHAEDAQTLFTQRDFSVEILTDQYGEPRTLVVSSGHAQRPT